MIFRPEFFYLKWAARLLMVLSIIFYLAPSELQAKDKSPKEPAIQKHLAEGIRLGKDGDYEPAIAELNKVLQLDPKNVHALNNIGVAYFKLNKLDEATSYFTKAIDSGVANATTYFFRGLIFGKYRHEPAKAVKDFTKAIELQPNFSKAYFNRAQAYSSLKKYDNAIADFNKMVEIRPVALKMVINKRAEVYFKKGDYAKARADVEKAKELGVQVDKKLVKELQKAMPRKQSTP